MRYNVLKDKNVSVASTVVIMEELVAAIADLKNLNQSSKGKCESYSPGVRTVCELGEITKSWKTGVIPIVQRGEFHIDLWFNKKSPQETAIVLYDHHSGMPGAFPLSYSIPGNIEVDAIALLGPKRGRKMAPLLLPASDPFLLAANM
ncbi:MAG: hypothetical protein ACLQF0_05635 [Dissulfurispiraceae bacterium]